MPQVRRKMIWITIMYWFLLLYILAALVWWFISLESQNQEMTHLRLQQKVPGDPAYTQWVESTLDLQRRKHAQYVGEGAIFMLLIVVGAVFVYRATRREWRVSQQQQNFMMAVTHELKTPIAVAKLNLETMSKHKLEPAMQEKMIRDTLVETDRLNDLANNILLASRLEGRNYQYHKELMSLNKIVHKSVDQFTTRFTGRKINITQDDEASIIGEPILIKLLLNNLIENAVKYTPADSPVDVAIQNNKKGIDVLVSDYGPGIPEAEKKQVFEKFYRMGNENTRGSKGTGLGLYLCKKIARDHDASILVKDNIPQGSIFTVHFQAVI